MWKVAPLKSSFMMAGILGFLVSLIYTIYGRLSVDWGFALCVLFAIIVISSIISMTYAPIEVQVKMAPDLFKEPAKPAKKARSKPKKVKRGKPKLKSKAPAKKKAAKKPAKKATKRKSPKKKPKNKK